MKGSWSEGRQMAQPEFDTNRRVQRLWTTLFFYHTGPKQTDNHSTHTFYELLQFDLADVRTLSEQSLVAIFAVGYPTRLSQYEVEFDEEMNPGTLGVKLGWSALYLQRATPIRMDLSHRLPLEAHERYRGDIGNPDGFSGAPVFFIRQDETGQCHLGFAGMITDAHRAGRFNVYEAVHIRSMLDGYFEAGTQG